MKIDQALSVLFLLMLFMCTFFLLGCKKNNPVEINSSVRTSIIPLTIGNTWNFSDISYDTLGFVIGHYAQVQKISGDTIIFGKKLTVYDRMCCANTDSGLVEYSGYSVSNIFPNDTIISYTLIYKYPTHSGSSYGLGFKVGTTDTVIIVPSGSFHCIQYLVSYSGILSEEVYISPGFGPVKYVSYYGYYCRHNPYQLVGYAELTSYIQM